MQELSQHVDWLNLPPDIKYKLNTWSSFNLVANKLQDLLENQPQIHTSENISTIFMQLPRAWYILARNDDVSLVAYGQHVSAWRNRIARRFNLWLHLNWTTFVDKNWEPNHKAWEIEWLLCAVRTKWCRNHGNLRAPSTDVHTLYNN